MEYYFETFNMLDSLYIKNYRNLEALQIGSLARVNLITGKNNTGKSSLLEAIAIYATQADYNVIFKLLEERGEIFRPSFSGRNSAEFNIKTLSSIFSNRNIGFEKEHSIFIGELEDTLFGEAKSSNK